MGSVFLLRLGYPIFCVLSVSFLVLSDFRYLIGRIFIYAIRLAAARDVADAMRAMRQAGAPDAMREVPRAMAVWNLLISPA